MDNEIKEKLILLLSEKTQDTSVETMARSVTETYTLLDVFNAVISEKDDMIPLLKLLKYLISVSQKCWIEKFCEACLKEKKHSAQRLFEKLSGIGSVRSFAAREHHVYYIDDFTGDADKAFVVLCLFEEIIKKCMEFSSKCEHSEAVYTWTPYMVCTISQHVTPNLWTHQNSEKAAADLLISLMQALECQTIPSVLHSGQENTVTKTITYKLLHMWKPKLEGSAWKRNPGTVASFCWYLSQVKFPYISEYLDLVLPPALSFTDDYIHDNKMKGMQCLVHIIQNSTNEELRWYGRADVIFEALKHNMYTNEVALLKLTHLAMIQILPVFEMSPKEQLSSVGQGKISKFDEIYQMILRSAEMENTIIMRRALTDNLHLFASKMGICVVKHFKVLMRIIPEYLGVYDGPEETARENVLKLLDTLLRIAWPRIPYHSQRLTTCLIMFINEITTDKTATPQEVKDRLVKQAAECLHLVYSLNSDREHSWIENIPEEYLSEKCVEILKTIIRNHNLKVCFP
ncbi:hypothetical protein ACJMK2_043688 [Sinanodonta woodiana]|uniref:TELO2-interacting protein 2 n=1 Tax=Sinanodonta woodiana TaxID=1069815 RepID=A0ABD3VYH3_SINWO